MRIPNTPRRPSHVLLLALLAAWLLAAHAQVALASGFPPRPDGAPSGSAFIAKTKAMSAEEREEAILYELTRGNVPSFLRKPMEVTWRAKGGDGRWHEITARVLPDYLAIGSDTDFVRIPMTPLTAQRLADRMGYMLPTTKLVDLFYQKAGLRLVPRPMPAGPRMVSNDYYLRHNRTIEAQRAGKPRTVLVAGHKKDIVVTNRLRRLPGRVAIYGWHRPGGRAIQPLSLVHENTYADYSHGVRFVERGVVVDGRPRALEEVEKDRIVAPLVSYEGPMLVTRAPLTATKYVAQKKAPAKKKPARLASNGKAKGKGKGKLKGKSAWKPKAKSSAKPKAKAAGKSPAKRGKKSFARN